MKRKTLELQRRILDTIKNNPKITMSTLERKIGTNPKSLREHCKYLSYLGVIKIDKNEKTTRLQYIK